MLSSTVQYTNMVAVELSLIVFLLCLSDALPVNSNGVGCYHSCQTEKTCMSYTHGETCYYQFTDKSRTWNESGEFCKSQNMAMAVVSKAMVTDGFKIDHSVHQTDVWLGGRATELNWSFVNGLPWNEVLGNQHQVSNNEQHFQCGVMFLRNDRVVVDVADCKQTYHFLCRFDVQSDREVRFYMSDFSTTWYEARTYCALQFAADNSDLFFPNNGSMEKIHLINVKLKPKTRYFTGLRKFSWEWYMKDGSSKQILQYNWQDDEPNKVSETCIAMYLTNLKWNNEHCSKKYNALCETEAEPKISNRTIADQLESAKPSTFSSEKIYIIIMIILAILVSALILGALKLFWVTKEAKRRENIKSKEIENNKDEITVLQVENLLLVEKSQDLEKLNESHKEEMERQAIEINEKIDEKTKATNEEVKLLKKGLNESRQHMSDMKESLIHDFKEQIDEKIDEKTKATNEEMKNMRDRLEEMHEFIKEKKEADQYKAKHDTLRHKRYNEMIHKLKEVASVLASHLLNRGLLNELAAKGVIDSQQRDKIKNADGENQVKELIKKMDTVDDETYFLFLKVLTSCTDNLLGSQPPTGENKQKSTLRRFLSFAGDTHEKESNDDKANALKEKRRRRKTTFL